MGTECLNTRFPLITLLCALSVSQSVMRVLYIEKLANIIFICLDDTTRYIELDLPKLSFFSHGLIMILGGIKID